MVLPVTAVRPWSTAFGLFVARVDVPSAEDGPVNICRKTCGVVQVI